MKNCMIGPHAHGVSLSRDAAEICRTCRKGREREILEFTSLREDLIPHFNLKPAEN